MKVICEQYRDGILDDAPPIEIPVDKFNPKEKPIETLERKMRSADNKGWNVERIENGFHAWKEYTDGNGTIDAPNRKDRYFRIVD